MIVGVGTDIVEIARIQAALRRHGERFLRRVLGSAEIVRFEARRARSEARGVAFLATRFAAKEAYSKAIGLGMRMPMTWRSMQLLNEPSGKPIAVADGALDMFMRERGWHAEVSVSDEHAFAVAFVVVSDSMPIHRSV